MVYVFFVGMKKSLAEAVFPGGKRFRWVCSMLLFMPITAMAAQQVTELTVEQQLRQQVNLELAQYVEFLGNPPHHSTLEITLPKGVQGAECEQLLVTRRNAMKSPVGRLSYQLNCQSEKPWQGRAIAQTHLWLNVVVAARALARGEILSAPQLTVKNIDVSQLHGDFGTQIGSFVGYQVKRKLKAGQPIQRHYLQTRYAIKKGNEVTLIVGDTLFSASAKGIALEAGRLGEQISVRNKSSGKMLRGTVVSSQQVKIFIN